MRHPRITIAAVAVALAATVGGFTISSAAGSSRPSPTATASADGSMIIAANPSSSATVRSAAASVQGTTETILVDGHGLPLYIYKPDTTTTSHVTGQLAALWPPLIAATPTADGVTGELASVATSNGEQVTYNGHFLYTFVEDRPGHVTGQGVQNFFVATPSLNAGASGTNTNSSKSGNSYGY